MRHGTHCRVPVLVDLVFFGWVSSLRPRCTPLLVPHDEVFVIVNGASFVPQVRVAVTRRRFLVEKISRSSRYVILMVSRKGGLFPRLEAQCGLEQQSAHTPFQDKAWGLEIAPADVCGGVPRPT